MNVVEMTIERWRADWRREKRGQGAGAGRKEKEDGSDGQFGIAGDRGKVGV